MSVINSRWRGLNTAAVGTGHSRVRYGSCPLGDCADNNFRKMPVLHAKPAVDPKGELKRILRLEVPVIVKLAERKLPLAETLRLGVGSIIEFEKANDEPLQMMINNKTIAFGEAVKVGENFGLRIKQIGDIKTLVAALGGAMR